MRQRINHWELFGFGFVCLAGTAGHFFYEWSGENRFVAALFSVNESTWEHMKLLYTAYLLYIFIECFSLAREIENFLSAKAAGFLAGLLTIPMVFYTLRGCFGALPDWMKISIFFLAAAAAFLVSCTVMKRGLLWGGFWQGIGFLLLWALLPVFVRFTFDPPLLPLFQDPLTLGYGIP